MSVFKATWTIIVLAEADHLQEAMKMFDKVSLSDLDYMIDASDWIGLVRLQRVVTLKPHRVKPELKRIGNDGTFFSTEGRED